MIICAGKSKSMNFNDKLSTIFESFVNQCLHPGLWDDKHLDKEISTTLLKIARDFIKEQKIPHDAIADIIITGSMANYNWSDYSDIDLHIVIDYDLIDDNEQLVNDLFNLAKSKWNNDHKIMICDHEVEIYVQDSQEPHHSTGVYSLLKGSWVESPVKTSSASQPSQDSVKRKADKYIDKINSIEVSNKPNETAKKMLDELKDMRMAGLRSGGEYSVENLVYKYLRNHQYLDKLREKIVTTYDDDMTIDDCEDDEC